LSGDSLVVLQQHPVESMTELPVGNILFPGETIHLLIDATWRLLVHAHYPAVLKYRIKYATKILLKTSESNQDVYFFGFWYKQNEVTQPSATKVFIKILEIYS
jgi:hypothetical protein